ncbi:putative ABC transport system permease protein, partial [Melghiribacillus thermohalophilus]
MIRLSFKRLLNRKGSTLTFLIALTALFALIPFGLQQSRDTKLAVDHSITEYGRGTYDLLVRPGGSRTETEKQLGMVEDNYIGDSQGGISISEWEELKEMEGIEVAAPVASLGYFRGNQMSIELPRLPEPTRFTWQFFTSDGLTKYPISEPKSLVYFEETHPGLIQYIGNVKTRSQYISSFMNAFMPPSFYPLVAIDIESEEQLTGIDFSGFYLEDEQKKEELLWLQTILEQYGNPPVIKVLKRDDLTIPLYLKIKAETLDVELEDYLEAFNLQESEWLMSIPDKEKLRNMFDMLQDEPIVEETEKEVDLSSLQSPFNGTPIQLNEAFEPSLIERYQADQDTAVYYVAKKIDYANLDQETPAVEIVKEGSPPAYKEVEQKGVSIYGATELPFVLFQAGTFSPKEQTNYLAASPLGIYGDMEAKTIDGQTLVPTTVPGSFISAPASGVTTLDSAEIIKGDKPIDAIRVRVAGIEGYDEEAQEKIDQVAKRLLEMGYEVDVVAGASFQEMTLDVEGIGFVNEQWTTLGVAQELGETWNSVTLLTTGLFVIFGILWVMARLTFEKNVLRGENDLLFTLGWGKTRIQLR